MPHRDIHHQVVVNALNKDPNYALDKTDQP